MRPFSRRMQKSTGRLYARSPATARVAADAFAPVAAVACSVQPLGDTGRRQDRYDEHMRMGQLDSWRVFVRQDDVEAAGLVPEWAELCDRFEYSGRMYSLRGRPLAQAHDDDGTPVLWSFDIDGIA